MTDISKETAEKMVAGLRFHGRRAAESERQMIARKNDERERAAALILAQSERIEALEKVADAAREYAERGRRLDALNAALDASKEEYRGLHAQQRRRRQRGMGR